MLGVYIVIAISVIIFIVLGWILYTLLRNTVAINNTTNLTSLIRSGGIGGGLLNPFTGVEQYAGRYDEIIKALTSIDEIISVKSDYVDGDSIHKNFSCTIETLTSVLRSTLRIHTHHSKNSQFGSQSERSFQERKITNNCDERLRDLEGFSIHKDSSQSSRSLIDSMKMNYTSLQWYLGWSRIFMIMGGIYLSVWILAPDFVSFVYRGIGLYVAYTFIGWSYRHTTKISSKRTVENAKFEEIFDISFHDPIRLREIMSPSVINHFEDLHTALSKLSSEVAITAKVFEGKWIWTFHSTASAKTIHRFCEEATQGVIQFEQLIENNPTTPGKTPLTD